MLRRWAVPMVMVLLVGVTDASAQGIDFRVLAGASPAGNQDGTGGAARFNLPIGIAVDSAGALYVADTQNCSIRKVTPAGAVITLTGTANSNGPCGNANGPSNVAQFIVPSGAAADSTGAVYVA